MAIEVVFQTPNMNYSDALDMFESGLAADARRAARAKNASRGALRALRCPVHAAQDLYVIVVFDATGGITAHVKACCEPTTTAAQQLLDAEMSRPDTDWRKPRP